MALQASIEGSVRVTVFAGSDGNVDSAAVSKTGGNRQLDNAALAAARKARFAGSAFKKRARPIACDLTYRFTILQSGVDVRVIEARLRQN
jgi:TonB family protein